MDSLANITSQDVNSCRKPRSLKTINKNKGRIEYSYTYSSRTILILKIYHPSHPKAETIHAKVPDK